MPTARRQRSERVAEGGNSTIRDSAYPGRALDSHNRQGAPHYRPLHPDVRADPQSAGKRTDFMSTLMSTACCEDADPATTAVEPIARDGSSQQTPCCPRRRRSPGVVGTAQNRRISRDGRDQRYSRCATSAPGDQRTERCSYVCQGDRMTFRWPPFWGCGWYSDRGIAGLRTRQGWAAPGGAQALIRSRPAGQVGPGTAGESFGGQQGSRQPIIGSGRPRSSGASRRPGGGGGRPRGRRDASGSG